MPLAKLAVIKKPDDLSLGMKVLRISIGGTSSEAYVTYRGDLREVQQFLREVVEVFGRLDTEPPISPDDGKQFA